MMVACGQVGAWRKRPQLRRLRVQLVKQAAQAAGGRMKCGHAKSKVWRLCASGVGLRACPCAHLLEALTRGRVCLLLDAFNEPLLSALFGGLASERSYELPTAGMVVAEGALCRRVSGEVMARDVRHCIATSLEPILWAALCEDGRVDVRMLGMFHVLFRLCDGFMWQNLSHLRGDFGAPVAMGSTETDLLAFLWSDGVAVVVGVGGRGAESRSYKSVAALAVLRNRVLFQLRDGSVFRCNISVEARSADYELYGLDVALQAKEVGDVPPRGARVV